MVNRCLTFSVVMLLIGDMLRLPTQITHLTHILLFVQIRGIGYWGRVYMYIHTCRCMYMYMSGCMPRKHSRVSTPQSLSQPKAPCTCTCTCTVKQAGLLRVLCEKDFLDCLKVNISETEVENSLLMYVYST